MRRLLVVALVLLAVPVGAERFPSSGASSTSSLVPICINNGLSTATSNTSEQVVSSCAIAAAP